MSRRQARDLFDCHKILRIKDLLQERLRIAFVVYGGMNRKDWRTVSTSDVDFDAVELTRLLLPTLRLDISEASKNPKTYGQQLLDQCRQTLSVVLPLTDHERKFLDLLLDQGTIDSTLLTTDSALQERIQNHPLLEWKALNVRQHKGS